MEPISGLMSGTLGLVCGGLCCVFAAILIVVAAIGLLRRKKAAPAPAPAASAPAATPAPAPAPAPAALPPPLPPTAASAHMDMPDEVEEFEDDDLPTTLMAPGGGPPEGMAPPPVPAPAPAPAAPPPVPVQRSIPRSAASSRLDVDQMPDIPTLRPGATIIPPDDWNDDYIDEADADETMLMPRPNLGLKKDD